MANTYMGEDLTMVVLPRPPAPVRYSPGPPPRGSYTGRRSTGAVAHPSPPPSPPPDIFGGYVGPAVDAAKQLAQQFMTLMGFPSGLDANQLTLQILQNRLTSDSQAAAAYLFDHGVGVTQDMRNAAPWAEFGLDAASFHSRLDTVDSTFQQLTAQDPQQLVAGGDALHALYYQAFRNNWSQSQILQHLQADPNFADLRTTQPWLAAGQGEQQVAQQFISLYGSAPVDTQSLAGWFRFNTGTQSLSRTGREAIMTAAPLPSSSETR